MRMWKMAHTPPSSTCARKKMTPVVPAPCANACVAASPSSAISMNSSSPANMLPNSRIDNDTGLASSSTAFRTMLAGNRGPEGRGEPLVPIAAETLGADRGEHHQHENDQRHGHRAVQVGSGQYAPERMRIAGQRRDVRRQ